MESEVLLRLRLIGLLGEARRASWRAGESVFVDFALRSDRRTLGRSGVNTGGCKGVVDCTGGGAGGADWGCAEASRCWCFGVSTKRLEGVLGEAGSEWSELCELVRERNLEGDRDRERRRVRTAEVTSI